MHSGIITLGRVDPSLCSGQALRKVIYPLDINVTLGFILAAMNEKLIPCFSCGALAPDIEGPSHKYMLSSPGCWALYGEILARDYSEFKYPPVHRLVVDAYAVQHPGKPMRQAIQSVVVHLIGLCLSIEKGMEAKQVTQAIGRATQFSEKFVWLDPPGNMGSITVADAVKTKTLEEYDRQGRAWARSVWEAWAVHHAQIRKLSRL